MCLAVAAGMLHWGDVVLQPFLRGWMGVAYWGTCLALSVSSVVFGIRDIRALRQSVRSERVALARRAYRELSRIRRGSVLQRQPETVASSPEVDSSRTRDP